MQEGLQGFTDSVASDPLFAAEGIDLTAAKKALKNLREEDRKLEEVWKHAFPARLILAVFPFTRSLHPFRFLEAFFVCEELRRKFLEDPSEDLARELIDSWKNALCAYQKDVRSLKRALKVSRMLDRGVRDGTLLDLAGNVIDTSEPLRLLTLFGENARALEQEIKGREAILKGAFYKAKTCPEPALPPEVTLPERERMLAEYVEEVSIPDFFLDPVSVKKRYGPYELRVPFLGREPARFFVYVLEHRSGEEESLVHTTNYYRFLKLGKSLKKGRAGALADIIYAPLLEAGIDYWYQSPSLFYTSLDSSYWMSLLVAAETKDRTVSPAAKRQQCGFFHLVLRHGASYAKIYRYMTGAKRESGELARTPFQAYFFRSFFTLYFLPFNQSVWRLSELPKVALQQAPRELDQAYLSLEELSGNLSDEEVKKVLSGPRIRTRKWRKMWGLTQGSHRN